MVIFKKVMKNGENVDVKMKNSFDIFILITKETGIGEKISTYR